jgi:hypothetical protein
MDVEACASGDVENTFDAAAGRCDVAIPSDIAANDFDAHGLQLGIGAPAEAADAVPAGEELLDDVAPQKSAAAGHKRVHQISS